MDVPYLQQRGNSWRYRRKVPPALKEALGKSEIVIPLGGSKAEALRRYPKASALAERLLADAARPSPAPLTPTLLELYRAAHGKVEDMGFSRDWTGWDTPDDGEGIGRSVFADQIIGRYRLDYDGHPIGIKPEDIALLHALNAGARDAPPTATLEDARRVYLKEKVGEDEKKRLQLDFIFKLIADVLPLSKPISSLRRSDAREVRDHFLDGRTPASAERYLNTVRAVINCAIKELDLEGTINPFIGLEVEKRHKAEPNRKKRRPFTEAELKATRDRILLLARQDLQLIWRILESTGCRLAEVAGLRMSDVHLDHTTPHIEVEWHDDRRVKTAASHRKVPLLGDALVAAREASKLAGDSPFLFPDYCRPKGADAASAALGKHVRATVTDSKVVTHSLRHRMKDRLRLAGVSTAEQEFILGHSSGKVADDYGGDTALLELSRRALEKALSFIPELDGQQHSL